MNLLVIHYAADTRRSSEFYQLLGFTPGPDGGEDRWIEHGGVSLTWAVHQGEGEYRPGSHDLSFSTGEALADVAARLEAAGYKADIKEEPWGPALHTEDPDGAPVMVCAANG